MGPSCSKSDTRVLRLAERPETRAALPPHHSSAVLGSWCLPDDKFVICGADGQVILYDVINVKVRQVGKHSASVSCVTAAQSSGGSSLVYSCSRDLTIKQWDLAGSANSPTCVFRGHELNVTAIAASDHGEIVCSGSRDCSVRTWDATTGSETSSVHVSRNVVTCMCWLPGTFAFAQGSEDLRLRVWDVRTMRTDAAQVFGEYTFFPLAVNVSTNGNLIATASKGFNGEGGEIRVWDRRKPGTKALGEMRGHRQDATGVVFLDHDKTLISASKDTRIKVWDLVTFDLYKEVETDSAEMYTGLSAPVAPAGIWAVGTSFQGSVLCFDANLRLIARAENGD